MDISIRQTFRLNGVHGCGLTAIVQFVVSCLLFAATISLSGCATTGEPPKGASVLYLEAVVSYNDADYKDAIDKFRKVAEGFPESPVAADAELLLADSYYMSAEFSDAASYYTNFASLHPNHAGTEYALFQKGMSYFMDILSIDRDQASTRKALLAFTDMISAYPSGIYADRAKDMSVFLQKRLAESEFYIGNFYFKDKKYKGALARFGEIIKKYPEAGISDRILYYIGRSYVELGERELARDAFTTLLNGFPASAFADDARKWLSNNKDG